jgi:putative endonuclease
MHDHYYIGHTENVTKRLEEHNHPVERNKFTAKHIPWELKMSFPISESRGDAMRIEKFIKRKKSKVFINKLITEGANTSYIEDLFYNVLKKRLVRAVPRTRD